MKKKGTSIVLIDSAGAGDIISMAGLTSPSIGHTVANVEVSIFCLILLLPRVSNAFHFLLFSVLFIIDLILQILLKTNFLSKVLVWGCGKPS